VDCVFPGDPSGFALLTVAVFLIFVPAAACTDTTISTTTGLSSDTEGVVQLTVLLAKVQLAGLEHVPLLQTSCRAEAFTKVTPAGSGSVMTTAEAVCLLTFAAVIA
jgi:hypothetical protein